MGREDSREGRRRRQRPQDRLPPRSVCPNALQNLIWLFTSGHGKRNPDAQVRTRLLGLWKAHQKPEYMTQVSSSSRTFAV